MEELIERILKAPPAVKWGGLGGFILLITGLNFFLVIQPLEDEISAQVNQQRQLDVQLAEKQEIAQNLNERRREMDVLEQKLAEALTELPEKADIEDLLQQLNDIGKKSGLEITAVEPGPESPSGFFARIPIKMRVRGNYQEIATFLQEVANMRRIVNIDNISLGEPSMKNEKLTLKSEFVATTFRFLAQKPNQGDKKAP